MAGHVSLWPCTFRLIATRAERLRKARIPCQRLARTYWYIASLETFVMIQLAAKFTEACFNIGWRWLLHLVEAAERNGARRSVLFGEMPRRTRPLRPVWRSEGNIV